ncbi:Modulator of FtsH protease HflK [bioreactor metagenome]|uniref:Modulator of FtsH protease HflK n=1 Tax=bioreactor metagenome TaxID=1076179 RepID=A0A644XAX6_9ZZZZ
MDNELNNFPKKKRQKIKRIFTKVKIFLHKLTQNENSTLDDIHKAFKHINPKKAIISLILGVLGIYLLTGIYIVNPGEQAIVRRFGEVLPKTISEGIHYRMPSPIDQVQKVNVAEVRRADVGMNLPEHMHEDDTPQAVQLLTGDENIITSQAIVHYKVKDAAKFLYNINSNDEQLVRYSVESAMVNIMSNIAVDDILSTEKVNAQNSLMEQAQQILDSYDSGIKITAFNIQAIVPPDAVAEAFRDVNAAKEEKEKSINEAKGYYNSLIPEARGKAETMLTQAESYKIEQINQATGDAEKFESLLKEYQNNSKIYTSDTTKYRLLLETFDKILPKVKKYIVDSTDGSVDVKMFDPSIMDGTDLKIEPK